MKCIIFIQVIQISHVTSKIIWSTHALMSYSYSHIHIWGANPLLSSLSSNLCQRDQLKAGLSLIMQMWGPMRSTQSRVYPDLSIIRIESQRVKLQPRILVLLISIHSNSHTQLYIIKTQQSRKYHQV